FASEFLFEGHDQLDRIEAVSTKVIDEARVLGHLVCIYPQMLDNDFFYPLANIAHDCNLVSSNPGSIAHAPETTRMGLMRRRIRSRADREEIKSAAPAKHLKPGYHNPNLLTSTVRRLADRLERPVKSWPFRRSHGWFGR